ncbi:MAG: autoinducer binding domain-containing protein [Rhodobacteraceae bacterium]|nr:autoinducer binding domain-containing protein [Paracoccaceae bacterium]
MTPSTELDTLSRIVTAPGVDSAWEVFCEAMAHRSFPVLVYGLARNAPGDRFGELSDALVLSTMEPRRMNTLHEAMAASPLTRFVGERTGTISWSVTARELAAGRLSRSELASIRLHRRLGYSAGITISFPTSCRRTRAGISFVAPPRMTQRQVDALWRQEGATNTLFAQVLHQRLLTLPRPVPGADLTERQREVLEWVAEGKSSAQISQILGLSVVTVEKHLRLAREALHTDTTAQALVRLVRHNALFATVADSPDHRALPLAYELSRVPVDGEATIPG